MFRRRSPVASRTWGMSATLETRSPGEVGTCETPEVSSLETVEFRIIGVRVNLRMKLLFWKTGTRSINDSWYERGH
jgi:hypothetical protein